MRERVVVTGLGVVSALGLGHKEYFKNLIGGQSGIKQITQFQPSEFGIQTQVAGEIKNFDILDYVSKNQARRVDRMGAISLAAGLLAYEDSRLMMNRVTSDQMGVAVGAMIGPLGGVENNILKKARGRKKLSARELMPMLPSQSASELGMTLGLKGPHLQISGSGATSAQSMGLAFDMIQNGKVSVMFCGGAESTLHPAVVSLFESSGLLSKINDLSASRPFDKLRDGFVMGEGSGMLVLESLSHARKRGAKIYAEIVGYGESVESQERGLEIAIQKALTQSKISKNKINYINANAASHPVFDLQETKAIKNIFNGHSAKIPVSSTKSMLGHTLGASAALGAIATVLSVKNNQIHPTLNLKNYDEECFLDYVSEGARDLKIKYALSNAVGLGADAMALSTSLVFKKYE